MFYCVADKIILFLILKLYKIFTILQINRIIIEYEFKIDLVLFNFKIIWFTNIYIGIIVLLI